MKEEEGGGVGGGADLNSASLCCHPEGQFLICRRTGTAIRPVSLTLAYNAKNTTQFCQLTERERDNMTILHHQQLRHALPSQGDTVVLTILYNSSLWRCIISEDGFTVIQCTCANIKLASVSFN